MSKTNAPSISGIMNRLVHAQSLLIVCRRSLASEEFEDIASPETDLLIEVLRKLDRVYDDLDLLSFPSR